MEQQINEKEQRQLSAQRKNSIMKAVWILIGIATIAGLMWLSVTGSQKKEGMTNTLTTVVSDDYIKGNPNASVTLIEYLDFECEACGAYFPLVKQLEKEFPNDLKIVLRYYPLPGHKNGLEAALAVEAASQQGKFFEMHDLLFTEQKKWGEKPVPTPEVFEGYAKQLGLDMAKFKQDVASQSVKDRVQRDVDSGTKLGNTGTPSFYLNGQKIQNPRSLEDFKTLIQAEILKAPKVEAKPLGEKVHEHADFAVYLNGERFDFKPAKYQSSDTNPLDPDAHLHDGNGDVTHKHRKGITLGYFFDTIGMKLDSQCFVTDNGKQYCNTRDKKLKMYVNGKENTMFGNYEFTDLDRILITYGDETGVTDQITSISDDACLYSEKCPERGKAPTENCVGGLGTEC
ncbi:MAG: hypothetical protein RJA61_248 [Candidatus Parcubacteria bacterium]|jgi:protein-disulfide isomerase